MAKPRKFSPDQYKELWVNLSKGLSISEAARVKDMTRQSMIAVVRGDTYVDWYKALDPKLVATVNDLIAIRMPNFNRERPKPKKPKKPVMDGWFLSTRKWTTEGLAL